jgi:carboxyl-terminal processing protease
MPLLAALAGLLLLLGGVWWGGHPNDLPPFLRDALVSPQTRVMDEAVGRILHDYYRPLDRKTLVERSLAALVASLHDRFSSYFTPKQYRDFNNAAEEQFSGVGMTVTTAKRGLRVLEVFDNSPAARAGIQPGDVVTSADGKRLGGRPEKAATSLIKGKPGTDVVLRLLRAGHIRVIRVTRAEVSVPVVASRLRVAHGVKLAQVALATFSSGAHGELRRAIDQLMRKGARGIVLDLRHNGGGLVEEARLVASIFLPDGPIVTTRGRTQQTMTLRAAGNAISTKIPVVVLVDSATASAAEIVAGALQDRHRATIVGTRTFGKGVFQEVRPLSNGGALDLTVGEYFLPGGRNLGGGGIKRGAGIKPDVPVKARGASGADPALSTALRVVAAKLK